MEWGAPEQADGASGEQAERAHLSFGGRVRWQALQDQLVAGPGIGESHSCNLSLPDAFVRLRE